MIPLIIVFVIVLLGVLVVHKVTEIIDNVKDLETSTPTICKRHDWYEVQDIDGNTYGLICIVCSKQPQELQ